MEFWTSSLTKAGRKDHPCATCGRIVPKGQPSYAEAGKSDGDFQSYRSCVPCHDLVARLYRGGHIDSDGFYFCDLPEIAREAGEQWPPALDGQP